MPSALSAGARALRSWREQTKQSQGAVAAKVGTDFAQISKYERGKARPGRTTAARIEAASGGLVRVELWDEPAEPKAVDASTEAAS